jgi:hypothetical protein
MVNLRVGLLVEEVRDEPLSHAGDSVVEPMLAVAGYRFQVMLAMALP